MSFNLFAASGLGRAKEIHEELGKEILETLYKNNHLIKATNPQFYDPKFNVYLNGRQVLGQCSMPGCKSEKAYADECDLGHPYEPKDLLNPKSILSNEIPEMRDVTNWYIDMEKFRPEIKKWLENLENKPYSRSFANSSIKEFLEPPTIYLKQEQEELLNKVLPLLPHHIHKESKNKAKYIEFNTLAEREKACEILNKYNVRFRNGKTLVPFRLTGNIAWGLKAPNLEELNDLTFWVWPESLWAPISFTKTYLESLGKNSHEWKKWWCDKESQVFQFIGIDNIYFYGPAEMAIFMGLQGEQFSYSPNNNEHIQLPTIVTNNHLLFLGKKISSSAEIKPPEVDELFNYYTSDQFRAHCLALSLGVKGISIKPKPFNSEANLNDADPVLKEGNLLSNVLNKAARSCFYTVQKYCDLIIPVGNISQEVLEKSNKAIIDFEHAVYKIEFHTAMAVVDNYIREINKYWTRHMKIEKDIFGEEQSQILRDTFHYLKVATILMHPIAPTGTEMIREYLNLDEKLWDWTYIFEPLFNIMPNPQIHKLKSLEAKIDFFPKHPSQFE